MKKRGREKGRAFKVEEKKLGRKQSMINIRSKRERRGRINIKKINKKKWKKNRNKGLKGERYEE